MYLEMFTMLHFRNSISRSLRNSQPMWSACRRRISTSTRVCYKAKENDLGFGPIKSPERPFEGLKLVTGLKIESEPDTDDSDVSEGEDQGDFENPIEEGQFHCRTLQLPDALKATIYQLTSGRSVRQMRKDVERLDYFLHTRTSSSVDYEPFSTGNPMHRETKNEKVARIMKDQKISKSKAQRMMAMAADGDETSLEMVDKRLHFGTKRSDGTTLLTSNSIAYGVNEGVAYAVSRLPAVYSAAYRVLLEIYCRDFDWTPKTALDFGSGVGTSMWAAHTLWEADTKYVNIDMSDDMNTISAFLNKDGAGHPIHNVKYRKFMPVLNKVKHDLVTCCFSLCELPSLEARKQAVENLWSQTDQYLVIVEPGTQEGFRNIREARKWIIGEADAELIAPCPHDDDCPMEANEKVCKFPQRVLYSRAQQEVCDYAWRRFGIGF
ncbi:hypothetical protein SARC_11472 [Sphaeroforma arctica JP610]|uniref:Methyltransferase-like protein 17, mitochondrial n=1 Tax=Sphaeroforma arctica JP610 TaxID=667725 RepID=A0A0L0FHR8_9EUKA|nr:hypothetical protein SARC_11472 [Sphaeroforma arctica JP610]KNC76016.1 hypothetical protein SARC_11472 [Sphaeroforma arctica JP610]|eukprot:XP_014149918.1 hypothetical protein SARC_11472 [Sphaeroforma arctica JP610]